MNNRDAVVASWTLEVPKMNHIPSPETLCFPDQLAFRRFCEYLQTHGDSLDALVRQLRADAEGSETQTLRDLSAQAISTSVHEALVHRLRRLVGEMLCGFAEPQVLIPQSYTGTEMDAALRWHAAKLTDFAQEISFASGD